jgi:rSAM/selenodomain-associated transferase 1
LPLIPQEGEALGERMTSAISWGLAQGYEGVLVVGSDIPTLPAAIFHEAVEQLANCDVVLGPTLDGGYYLVAAKENCPAIFQDIAWGAEDVFAATMRKIKLMSLKPSLLRPWNDVDTFEDLKLLKEQLDILVEENAPVMNCHTRKVLENLAHKL